MLKKKIIFILNPISGTGKQKNAIPLIDQYLDHTKYDYQIIQTEYAGHAKEIAQDAVDKADIVIAIGGDGTINESFQALVNTDVIFGIIPCGSGNGLARFLKIPIKIKEAIETINKANSLKIDSCTVNNTPFLSIAGVGFDAYIAKKFDEAKFRGLFSYLNQIIKSYSKYQEKDFVIRIDNQELNRKAFLISFANSDQFGNNAIIAPQAVINDGELEVCIVRKIPFIGLPRLAYQVFNRNIQKSNYYHSLRARDFTIRHENDLIVNIDGEPVQMGKEIHIKTYPKSIKMIVP